VKYVVVYSKKDRVWGGDLIADGLGLSLRKLGKDVEVRRLCFNKYKFGDNRGVGGYRKNEFRNCIVISMLYYAAFLMGKLGGINCEKLIVYNFDEIAEGSNTFNKFMAWTNSVASKVGRLPDVILDYCPSADIWQDKIESMGIQRVFCPIGYSKRFSLRKTFSNKYDVMFFGYSGFKDTKERKNDLTRRAKHIQEFRKYFEVDNISTLYAEKRLDDVGLLNVLDSKIWLHLHRLDGFCNFPDIRIIVYGMSNRICVVSEPTRWNPFFVDGVHWFSRTTDEMIELCPALLKDDELRNRVANNGYLAIKKHWRFEDHVRRALRELELL